MYIDRVADALKDLATPCPQRAFFALDLLAVEFRHYLRCQEYDSLRTGDSSGDTFVPNVNHLRLPTLIEVCEISHL